MHICFDLPVQGGVKGAVTQKTRSVWPVQLIPRLVTHHVLLILVIIAIDCQIYSQLNLEIFRVSSKNAWILNQMIPSAIPKSRTLTSVTNWQNASLFHMFCCFCQTTCTVSFRQFINSLVEISTSCPMWIRIHLHHHHHHSSRVGPW